MSDATHPWLMFVCALLLLMLLYIAAEAWLAKVRVDRMDRTRYFLCDRHGSIPQEDMLVIAEFDDGTQVPPMCPLCYKENANAATERLLKITDDLESKRDAKK